MTRRGKGEGWAVRKRGDGHGYATGFTDPSGKRRAIHGKTAREAREKRDAAIRDAQRGVIAPPLRQTVGAFCTAWVDDVVAHTLAPRTVERYRGIVAKHIVPGLGRLPLIRLSSQHIARLYADKADELAPASIRYVHAVLRSALQQAVAWRLLPSNPASDVKPPRKPRSTVQPLNAPEARALLEAAKGDPLEALYVVALHTGMRLGELLALTWSHVDSGHVAVRATLHRVGKGEYAPHEPKTASSRRTIPLDATAAEALRAHRVREAERMIGLGRGMDEGSLIFTDRWGEPIYWARITERHLHPLCDAAGIRRIRFHDLRHTAATTMLRAGVPLHIVSQILGHSSPTTTLGTYAHVIPGDLESAVKTLDVALGAVG